MPLNKTARALIVVISIAFLAVVGGLIARAHSYTGTDNSVSALESQLRADRNRDLTVSSYYPADFYGEGWVPAGAICPGADEADLATSGLPEELVERFNLNGEAVADDTNYLVIAHVDPLSGQATEFEIDQMDIDDVNLCLAAQRSGYGSVLPIASDILTFEHHEGTSYLVLAG